MPKVGVRGLGPDSPASLTFVDPIGPRRMPDLLTGLRAHTLVERVEFRASMSWGNVLNVCVALAGKPRLRYVAFGILDTSTQSLVLQTPDQATYADRAARTIVFLITRTPSLRAVHLEGWRYGPEAAADLRRAALFHPALQSGDATLNNLLAERAALWTLRWLLPWARILPATGLPDGPVAEILACLVAGQGRLSARSVVPYGTRLLARLRNQRVPYRPQSAREFIEDQIGAANKISGPS